MNIPCQFKYAQHEDTYWLRARGFKTENNR